jgi:translocator protein
VLERVAAFRRRNPSRLALFLMLVSGTGFVVGALNAPGRWYAALNKPPFNPPDWALPRMDVLFLMIAAAGFPILEREPRGPATKLWALQMAR